MYRHCDAGNETVYLLTHLHAVENELFLVLVDKETALFMLDLSYGREADCHSFLFTFIRHAVVYVCVEKSVGITVGKL